MTETKKQCAFKDHSKCAGSVKTYSLDIDLPELNLCARHWFMYVAGEIK